MYQRTAGSRYSNIAPVSWLIADHVARARTVYSFSDWKVGDVGPEQAAKAVRGRVMPPSRFLMLHPEANLTDAEIESLAQGLVKSLK